MPTTIHSHRKHRKMSGINAKIETTGICGVAYIDPCLPVAWGLQDFKRKYTPRHSTVKMGWKNGCRRNSEGWASLEIPQDPTFKSDFWISTF